ncbi:hypothetical protein [Amycolatopsis balhimycina]|uniref:hypothetical protein n=1 Tax=Amycolatopsis balhimycina TaxID=208443 RepID=UPI000F79CE01|nr:hypothetical protein [Amycolatopsis balhimycina]
MLLAEEMVSRSVAMTGPDESIVNWWALPTLELLTIRLFCLHRSIGLEVWDSAPATSEALLKTSEVSCRLVEALHVTAARWGEVPDGRGRTVWAQLPVFERTERGLPKRPRNPTPYPRRPAASGPAVEVMERILRGIEGF